MCKRSLDWIAALAAVLLLTAGAPRSLSGVAVAKATNAVQAVAVGIPNIRVSHDGYAAHAEPSVAVNPRNPLNLIGATQLIETLSQPTVLGTFASFDGGRTWRGNGTLPFPPGTVWGDDVTVAFDAHGAGFVCAMATSGLSRQDRGVYVWRTDDGGRTFHPAVAAMRHQLADHPWLAADTTPAPGGGDLYATWVSRDHAALGFSRSVDGGRSFATPRDISTPPGGVSIPAVAAGPRGAVYVVYESARQGADSRSGADARPQDNRASGAADVSRYGPVLQAQADAQVEVLGSTNHGRSFGSPVALGAVPSDLTPAPGLRLPTGPSVATDPRDGTVYVAYAAYRLGTAHVDIMLARSRDGGHTWSAAVRVTNAVPSDQAVYFQPQVVVDGTQAVDVTYFALAHGHIDVILARSSTHGAGFASHQQVTSRPFDPALGLAGPAGGKHGLWWIGDYQGLAAGGGEIHPFWNDTRPGHLEIFTAAVSAPATR